MTTTRDDNRSVSISALIGILFIMGVFGLVMFLPAAYAEENFECTQCCSGTYTMFHESKELVPLLRGEDSGIMISKSENKFLDRATLHYEWIQRGGGEKREGYTLGKIVDPDGDIIVVGCAYKGPGHEAKFLQGTGKYKGITGSFKATRLATGKPVMNGTYQWCRKIKGTFELSK
jgi:hypothetical protein